MPLKIESTTSPESAALVRNFLSSRYSGVLATSDKADQPHAAVVYFSLEDDYSLIFGTKSETQKFRNIEENKQVAFVVYDEESQTTVQISGYVEIISDTVTRQNAINKMFSSSAERSGREIPPADKLLAGEYVALRIVPMVMKMAVFARPDSEGDDLYETVLFSN